MTDAEVALQSYPDGACLNRAGDLYILLLEASQGTPPTTRNTLNRICWETVKETVLEVSEWISRHAAWVFLVCATLFGFWYWIELAWMLISL